MKNFAAIDFETANNKRTSVCSVGIVIVKNGVIVDKIHSLIRPLPNYYSAICTSVHGMTSRDTQYAPSFNQVWQNISSHLEDLPLVAHNATFDRSCLQAAHEIFEMDYPNYEFYCTLQAARSHFGSSLPNHKLDTVSRACGFDLKNHHHALADAEACAAIALKIL